MLCIGIDPDTFNTGVAVVSRSPQASPFRSSAWKLNVLWVGSASVPTKLKVEDRVIKMIDRIFSLLGDIPDYRICRGVVEGQKVYPRSRVRPNDLIQLAHVAGISAALLDAWFRPEHLCIPEPQQWKGSVPKLAHQRRILKSVGLTKATLKRDVPGAQGMTDEQLGHVIDAIGLAAWGASR